MTGDWLASHLSTCEISCSEVRCLFWLPLCRQMVFPGHFALFFLFWKSSAQSSPYPVTWAFRCIGWYLPLCLRWEEAEAVVGGRKDEPETVKIFSYCQAFKGKRLLGCCMETEGRREEGLRDELNGVRRESWYCVNGIKTCWTESIWCSR